MFAELGLPESERSYTPSRGGQWRVDFDAMVTAGNAARDAGVDEETRRAMDMETMVGSSNSACTDTKTILLVVSFIAEDRFLTVSYTHLTLPTILLV